MEVKKNPNKDLHRKYWMFFFVGGVVSLLITLGAFEWRTYDDLQAIELEAPEEEFDDVIEIPITEQPPPPPPVIQQPEIVEVPDDEEIEEQAEIELDVDVKEVVVKKPKVKKKKVKKKMKKKKQEPEVFLIVEDQPEPEGGMKAFYKFISKKLKYPKQARRMGVEGKVFMQFVVDKDGSLTDIKVVRGIGSGCDEEAIRVLKMAPKWKPGKQRGRAVKVRMSLPIVFKLH